MDTLYQLVECKRDGEGNTVRMRAVQYDFDKEKLEKIASYLDNCWWLDTDYTYELVYRVEEV